MIKRGDLPSSVLERRAIVYVRQSTLIQVEENLESQRRQYELANRAREIGFRDILVIDDDLGISASGTSARPGFESLVAQICEGVVGGVFCLGSVAARTQRTRLAPSARALWARRRTGVRRGRRLRSEPGIGAPRSERCTRRRGVR